MSKWFSVNQGNDCVFHKITAEQKNNLNLSKHTLSDWPVLSLAMSPCALTTGKKEKNTTVGLLVSEVNDECK